MTNPSSVETRPMSGYDKAETAKIWVLQRTLRQVSREYSGGLELPFDIKADDTKPTRFHLLFRADGNFAFEANDGSNPLTLIDALEVVGALKHFRTSSGSIIEQTAQMPALSGRAGVFRYMLDHVPSRRDTDDALHEVVADHLSIAGSKSEESYVYLRRHYSAMKKNPNPDIDPNEIIQAEAQEPLVEIGQRYERAKLVVISARLAENCHRVSLLQCKMPPIMLINAYV